ncbi:MAG: hypothetical protein WBA12_11350, partial [Catalinimonas sp.]
MLLILAGLSLGACRRPEEVTTVKEQAIRPYFVNAYYDTVVPVTKGVQHSRLLEVIKESSKAVSKT